ncbi:hypothetical protein J008_05519 [Cryptococcus neoformans]|nr:hypothetical protein C362_05787 [Cryptococcus neoformans var. grubii Bt1]OXH24891.1 hypothetical protein J008_05519 [Cryptococcus neoformans var. grubii]
MADEEVDWGFDEQEDEWRGAGLAENDNAARADDDVISLEGAEDAEDARRAASPGRKSNPNANGRQPPTGPSSKNPPTGPRRGRVDTRARPDSESNAAIVPSGPRGDSRSNTDDNQASMRNTGQANNVREDSPPLPSGWTAVMSKSHNRPFYYHKESNRTVWEKPTLPVEQLQETEPVTPASQPDPAPAEIQRKAEIKQTEKRVPSGPAAQTAAAVAADTSANEGNRNIASAYARRNAAPHAPAPSSGPIGPNPPQLQQQQRRTRARSPPPHMRGRPGPGHDDGNDAKRFKQEDGGRRTPPHAAPQGDYRRPAPMSYPSRGQVPQNQTPTGPAAGRYDGPRDRYDRSGPAPPPSRGPIGPPPDARGFDRRHPESRPPPRAAAPSVVQGANSAPISNNRWGQSTGPTTPSTSIPLSSSLPSAPIPTPIGGGGGGRRDVRDREGDYNSRPYPPPVSAPAPAPVSGAYDETPEAKRQRLREEARKAEEVLLKVKEEEARLEEEERRRAEREREEKEREERGRVDRERERLRQLDFERDRDLRERDFRERDVRDRDFDRRGPPPPLSRGGERDRFDPIRRNEEDRRRPGDARMFPRGDRDGRDRRLGPPGPGPNNFGPPPDYPEPPRGGGFGGGVPMRDRLGPRDRDQRNMRDRDMDRGGPPMRRPLSSPPFRRSPPPLRGPPGRSPPPSFGGPGPLPPRDRDSRDREYSLPPGRGGDPGFAGPTPKDLLRRLGRRIDNQLAEPMSAGAKFDRDDRRDRDRRGPPPGQGRPLAERMSAGSTPNSGKGGGRRRGRGGGNAGAGGRSNGGNEGNGRGNGGNDGNDGGDEDGERR